MELMLILRVLLRRWWLILLPVVIVGVIALPKLLNRAPEAGGGFNTTFRYTAAQRFNLPERDGDYQDVWLASELTVNAMTDWVRTSTFVSEIQNIVGSGINLSGLNISADNKRSIGTLSLTYTDEAELKIITDAAIQVLETRTQAYFPHLGGEPAQVNILDIPQINAAPAPLGNRFGPVIQMGVALLAGIALAFLAEYFDDRLRRREEIEAQGIHVMGAIPKH